MNKTNIEWVKNPDGSQGYTWNPITGCLNHTNGLCNGGGFPCYAYRLAKGRLRERYFDNPNIAIPKHLENKDLHSEDVWEYHKDTFYPRFWEDKLKEMTRRNDYLWADDIGRGRKTPNNVLQMVKPKGIFVCDMSDLFGIGIPEAWTEKVLDEIWGNKRVDRFYLLTKQPQNLVKWSPFPDNCWVGATICNENMAVQAVNPMCKLQAKIKYISFEPLLGRIRWYDLSFVNWVIIGAQTKPYKPPKIEWVREIVEACDKARIPVFLKNNLIPLMNEQKGMDNIKGLVCEINLWHGVQTLRQELSNG